MVLTEHNGAHGLKLQFFWLPVLLLIPGLISAFILGVQRYNVESANKSVELALDYGELQNLSASSGKPMPEVLSLFAAKGITGVAVSEDLLGDLANTGQAFYTVDTSALGPVTYVSIPERQLASRVFRALSVRLNPDMVSPHQGAVPQTFKVSTTPAVLNAVGVGLPQDAVGMVKGSGLDVIARLQNNPALTKDAVEASINELKSLGVKRFISNGDEVFGFKGLIPDAAKSINRAGMLFGSVEFSKQKGDAGMARALHSNFIRVHSITCAEMAGMAPSTAVERFERAVRERGIRLCYVRLPLTSGPGALETSLNFAGSVRSRIEGAGYSIGPVEALRPLARPKLLLALMGLSVASGLVLLAGSLVSFSRRAAVGALFASAAVFCGLSVAGEKGAQLVALASALIFPSLGVSVLAGPYFTGDKGIKKPVGRSAVIFAGVCGVTLLGALLVVGILADRSYMVKVNQFAGIKAAHLLPLMYILLIMAAGLPMFGRPFPEIKKRVAENFRGLAGRPLLTWHAVAVAAVMVLLAVALMRTGNDSGVGVSALELKFRALLDKIMVVRPRTKEFMIGHPAFFMGVALLLARRRLAGLLLVAFGMIGQVSLLNTFCHIHTPLAVSILRAFNGMWCGLVIGVIIWWLFVQPQIKKDLPDKSYAGK